MYNEAKQQYLAFGVDAEQAMARLSAIPISVHCWQGDDVIGLVGGGALTGGIQTTGNYPGRARNAKELMADYALALSLMPGNKRINLHAIYAISDAPVEQDRLEGQHFDAWIEFAKAHGVGIDFNPTFFSSPMVKDGLTLSSPDAGIRAYWVRHGIACRRVAQYIADRLGQAVLCNIWIPDGLKDVPADRLGPRLRLKDSLDQILSEKLPGVIDSVESKVFGIGVESYTVGSNEFYQNYAAQTGVCCLLDNGHYHPTETVGDKIPALLAFYDRVALHVTRGVRWDSDHVALFTDELREIATEIVRNDATDKVLIGLDYFDASINRIAAWVVGQRAMQKALLYALLLPKETMRRLQDEARFTELMVLGERVKTLPFSAVWEEYLRRQGLDEDFYDTISDYERKVLGKRI